MAKTRPPAPIRPAYEHKLCGVFGSFGSTDNVRVCYLQTALLPSELEKVQLVHELPGSDRWPIRDLFQREVDTARVEESILPWLQDKDSIKFFNPLTLILLPLDHVNGCLVPQIPVLQPSSYQDAVGDEWSAVESQPAFRFSTLMAGKRTVPEYSCVEWNSRNARLVAIDGQHRLSALKRYLHDPKQTDTMNWTVPVVIAALDRTVPANAEAPSFLDVVRGLFIGINTQARAPCRSRQILLNDADVNHIACQELVDYAHANDISEDAPKRRKGHLPLLFFDWRGVTIAGKETHSPFAVKAVSEIADWCEYYLLGPNLTRQQSAALRIDSDMESLQSSYKRRFIHAQDIETLRAHLRSDFLKGLAHLLETFIPYKQYISRIEVAEASALVKSDTYRHAYAMLRFGTHRGPRSEIDNITRAASELATELAGIRNMIPDLILLDIGMRGVAYSYGAIKPLADIWAGESLTWGEYAEWFSGHLNTVYKAEWFGAGKSALRLNVTRNAADNIVNHKLGDAKKAFGPVVSLAIIASASKSSDLVTPLANSDAWRRFAESVLRSTLVRGYTKQLRAEARGKQPGGSARLSADDVKAKAIRSATAHLARLRTALD